MSEENIRLSCTLDKNGNPTAQARMTATDDKQKCQIEIARRIPIMFVPGIMGSNLQYRNGWDDMADKAEANEKSEQAEVKPFNGETNADDGLWSKLKDKEVEESWMPPNGLILQPLGAFFTDGLFRCTEERHKEIHHDLTSVSWEGDIDEMPKTCLKITYSEKRRQDILKHGEIMHDRKLKQLQKYRLPDDPQIIAEKQRYVAWRKCWEENKPDKKEQIRQELRFRGWGTVHASSYHKFLVFLEENLHNLAEAVREASDRKNCQLTDQDYINFVSKHKEKQPWQGVLARIDRYILKSSATPPAEGRGKPPKERPLSKEPSSEAARRQLAEWLKKAVDYQYPVYACGYNWLRDNSESGNRYHPNSVEFLESKYGVNTLFGPSDLNSRIDHALKECNAEQFLIVSHSMGGLVTRAYAKQATGDAPENTKNGDKICGIFHGVMPATGAPAFYKRLKAGFGDEPNPCNWKWYDYINPLSYVKMGLTSLKDGAVAKVLGATARETSPILLNAPGAMQLMPWPNYRPLRGSSVAETAQKAAQTAPLGNGGADPHAWLDIYDHDGKTKICSFNTEDIYQAYNAWYGLWPTMPKPAKQEGGDGNQEKAVMEKGRPEQIDKINFNPTGRKTIFQKGKTDVEIFKDNLEKVKKFQDKHAAYYLTDDDKTRIGYCDSGDHLSWDTISWVCKQKLPPGTDKETLRKEAKLSDKKDASGEHGTVEIVLGTGRYEFALSRKQNSDHGDATVPSASGAAPITQGVFKQEDVLTTGGKASGGYEHSAAYNAEEMQNDALFAILEAVAKRAKTE